MSEKSEQAQLRTLRAMGVTLIGVVLSVCVTVAFGMPGPWWLRLAVASTVGASLIVLIKFATSTGGKGLVAHVADWITGTDDAGGGSERTPGGAA